MARHFQTLPAREVRFVAVLALINRGLTVPDGWLAEETDSGVLKLRLAGSDNALLIWKDLLPVETNNRDGSVGKPMLDADATADGIVEWLTTLSDVDILEGPTNVTFGDGIEGVELTLTTSNTADFAEPDCPDNPHCVALFTDIQHWPPRESYRRRPYLLHRTRCFERHGACDLHRQLSQSGSGSDPVAVRGGVSTLFARPKIGLTNPRQRGRHVIRAISGGRGGS